MPLSAMNKNDSAQKVAKNGKVSEIITDFTDGLTKDTVTLNEFKEAISHRSYGLLIFFFALPCIIPIPTPGLSAIVGIPLAILTFQMMIGLKSPWLPKFIANKKIKTSEMKKVCKYVVPYLKKLEVVMQPRLKFLVGPIAVRIIAVACFAMSVIILFPVPFGNAIPALAIWLFALAILTHDGVVAIFAIIITMLSTILVSAAAEGISSLFS